MITEKELKYLSLPTSVLWKPQEVKQYGCTAVPYVSAGIVRKVLNDSVGISNWQTQFKEVKGNLFCGVGINVNDTWIWKWDCGTESQFDKEKGEATDAFKRAAKQWGVGEFCNQIGVVSKIPTTDYKKSNGEQVKRNGKVVYYPCTEKGNQKTRLWTGEDLMNYINGKKGVASYSIFDDELFEKFEYWIQELLNKGESKLSILCKILIRFNSISASARTKLEKI